MKSMLRVLVVEDSEFDAQIMVNLLRKAGYQIQMQRVETAETMQAALMEPPWDVILADYNLPAFDALAALGLLQQTGLDVPFIIVSGGIGEDVAVAAMKAGAHDYLMKGNLNRLPPAVERELREAAIRASQREAKRDLLESELRYRLLWETCPDAVILMDAQSMIHFANPAVGAVFGFAPEEIVGRPLMDLQPDRLRGAHVNGLKHYLETGVKRLNWRATETVGRRKDGVEIPIEVSFSDMELQGQRRFVGFIRDISERKRAERELRENKEQFRVAREIQQRLFPKSAPALPGYDLAGASHPAEATGGDYFDFLPLLQSRLGLVVGDVTGHGVGPALLMAETRAYLRVLAGRREDVGEILTRANGILAEDVGVERFITLCLVGLDPAARSLVYASAGHPPGYILGRDGQVRFSLPRTGIPLGMRPDAEYASSPTLPLEPGDLLLLSSDGIEEAVSPEDELFGVERMLDVVRSHRERTAHEIVDALYCAVRAFGRDQAPIDDFTAIILKVV